MSATTDQLEELRAEFAGLWRIFRGQCGGVPVSWCASLRHPAAGIDPTVICTTAEELRAALAEQRDEAIRGPLGKQVFTL